MIAALLRGEHVAQQIQLAMEYAPDPPFHAGSPVSAPAEVLAVVEASYRKLTEIRATTAKRIKAQRDAAAGHASATG
jgi:cyclohexyl-isocyanide hydratase